MTTSPPSSTAGIHVLVAGAGGIGCPTAWALACAGVGRVTLLDPDVVELSNLPRQVLFHDADVGRSKARIAAGRVAADAFVAGVPARLDETTAHLMEDAHVIVDATDGAHAKDWINQAAVRRGLPLIHAAGLRSEARLMAVPAGGRPCLACLFGRLTEETGSCADLGVWNGVVGTVGFLAAHAAVERALAPDAPSPGYAVLDFETGRALTLGARAARACPVCATPADVEPYPDDVTCGVPQPLESGLGPPEGDLLDLYEEHCPLNLLRARQALAAMAAGDEIWIGLGSEGAETVPDGVAALGHKILARHPMEAGRLLLHVRAAGEGADHDTLDGDALQRYARQVVLPEVAEAGQARLAQATVRLLGSGPAHESAATYLRAAGVGRVTSAAVDGALTVWAAGSDLPDAAFDLGIATGPDGCRATTDLATPLLTYDAPPAVALAWGTLLADLVQRRIVLGDGAPQQTFSIDAAGTAR